MDADDHRLARSRPLRQNNNADRPVHNWQMNLNGHEVTALADTGVSYSVLSEIIVRRPCNAATCNEMALSYEPPAVKDRKSVV